MTHGPYLEEQINLLRVELRSLRLPSGEHARAQQELADAIENMASDNSQYAALLHGDHMP